MNLIYQKRRTYKRQDGISITQTGYALRRDVSERLVKDWKKVFIGVGLNNEGNLTIYLSQTDAGGRLFKMKENNGIYRAHLTTEHHKKIIKPYVGHYKVKYVSANDNSGIKEVILKAAEDED